MYLHEAGYSLWNINEPRSAFISAFFSVRRRYLILQPRPAPIPSAELNHYRLKPVESFATESRWRRKPPEARRAGSE